jgi:membrane protein required for colicin V production
MSVIDIIIILLGTVGIILGAVKGFVRQLASILGFIVGLIAAKMLYVVLAEKLFSRFTDNVTLAQGGAFILIFIAIPVIFAIVASALTKALKVIKLGWLNGGLGALLGMVKYLLLVCLLIGALEYIDSDSKLVELSWKQESFLYYPLQHLFDTFFPIVTEAGKELINT